MDISSHSDRIAQLQMTTTYSQGLADQLAVVMIE